MAATGKPSKSKIRDLAFARVQMEEFQQLAGDAAGLKALVDRYAAEVEAELEAAKPVAVDEEEVLEEVEV